MSEFHFLRPDWFWLLVPIALLIGWLWRRQLRSRSWQAVCDPQLLPHLLLGRSQRRQNWPLYLLLLALLLTVTAQAGPTWQRQPQPLFRQQSALVLLLDLSASMTVADLKPSRMVRARLKIADILRQRREGQTALVVFAGEAFTVTPLTDDSKTIAALLDSLEPGLMPVFGSRPDLAIAQGRKLLQQAGLAEGQLLLISDDDQPEAAITAAEELQLAGYRLSVLGVGTAAGAPIPLSDGGFFKDSSGQMVLPQLKAAALQRLATAGGGHYQTVQIDDSDLQRLLKQPLHQRLETEPQQSERLGDRWRDVGGWLLWALALLVACAFRRGWLTVFILCTLLPVPAQALDWQQLWQRADQQAAKAFENGDFSAAGEQFQDSRWQATARYRNGDYAAAAELLKSAESADDWYNRGNALAKAGRLAEALEAYAQSLKLDAEHQDALANQKVVEEALKQQQPPQDQPEQTSPQEGDAAQQDESGSAESGAGERQPAEPQDTSEPAESGQQPQKPEDSNPQADQPQTDSDAQKSESAADAANDKQQPSPAAAETEQPAQSDKERASQQWLQRIPDDPGGLLRRKFLYQSRQRERQQTSDKPW